MVNPDEHRYMSLREVHGPFPHAVAIKAKPPSELVTRAQRFLTKCRDHDEKARVLKKFAREHQLTNLSYINEMRRERFGREGMLKGQANFLRDESKRNLDDRRQKLIEFLAKEEKQLFGEIHSETAEERYQKNRERAKFLKEKRERERLEEVEKLRDMQFRQYSEELRTILSKRMCDEVCTDRKEQVLIKAEKARLRQKEQQMYAELWNKDFLAKAAKEEQEALEKAEKKRALNAELRDHIIAAAHKTKYDKEKLEEARLWKQETELRQEEDKQEQLHQQQLKKEQKKVLDDMLEAKNRRLAKEKESEDALSAKILEVSMQVKKSDAEAQMRQKIHRRDAQLKYMRHLEEQREEQKRRDRDLERLISEDLEAMWGKDLMKRRLVKETKKAQLVDMIKGRKEQLRKKTETSAREIEEMKVEREKAFKVAEEQRRLEQEEIAKVKATNKQHQTDLLAQIKHCDAQKEMKKQEKMREQKEEFLAEEKWQEKLKEILSKADCYYKSHPLRVQHKLNRRFSLGSVDAPK